MVDKVLVTRRIPEPGLEILRAHCEVELFPHDRNMTREELLAAVKEKDGLLSLLTDRIDAGLFDAAPKLRAVANCAVGFNNIDLAAATARGIPATNTPGVLTDTTADLTWALIMSAARRIAEADRFTRAGKFDGWGPMMMLGGDIHGKTLGIVGMGRIGQAVAKRAGGFHMRILYSDSVMLDPATAQSLPVALVDFETLLEQSDFVTLHVPLNDQTYHLIGEKEFALMKPTAYLINTSRGPVVDEKALVKALQDCKIAGAGLDVFEHEPQIEPELLQMENVVLLPHIGSASFETRARMAIMAAENLVAALRGERPPNCVNPEVFLKK
ncbi:MAG TPA: D-glycerate dehydrogenase [bacterium]|nr:D-glycerate dehydrogenase [bacterium]HQO33326.1 D-glycerate dehydrogenase [bacterium]HQP99409.1 D-glycerate dehydrogenase [bacterium]